MLLTYAKTALDEVFDVSDVTVILTKNLTNERAWPESHEFWELLYVESGVHRMVVDNDSFTLSEGQAVLIPPYAFHTESTSVATVSMVSFYCESEKLSDFSSRALTLSQKSKALKNEVMALGSKILTDPVTEKEIYGFTARKGVTQEELQTLKCYIELLLLSLSDSVYEEKHENKSNMIKVIEYMSANIEKNITLDELAKYMMISVPYLKKLFKEEFNCGPIAYLLLLKIEEAKRLMRETDMNFSEIADSLGYCSVHHFSRMFKEKTGKTPGEYAKLYRKNQR